MLKSRQPTRLDPNCHPRDAKVKVGDVVGEICLLTGGKRSATVAASMSRKAPPKLRALEVPKQALRAVVERRPTVVDALARSIANRWVADQINAVGMTPAERATQELRLAHRITESAVGHFKGSRAMWAKAGSTVKAAVHKLGLAAKLASGGAGALFAAAAGAAGKKANVAMSDAECVAALSAAPLLRTLHAAELHSMVAHGVRKVRCPAGELHIRQGNPGGSMYLVLEGHFDVLVKASAGSGALECVGHFGVGEAFGEMSLLTGAKRTASLRATVDSLVLEVSRKGVESTVRERPLLVDDFAKFISDRQRENQAMERTFAQDETQLNAWTAEQNQQLVEAIEAGYFVENRRRRRETTIGTRESCEKTSARAGQYPEWFSNSCSRLTSSALSIDAAHRHASRGRASRDAPAGRQGRDPGRGRKHTARHSRGELPWIWRRSPTAAAAARGKVKRVSLRQPVEATSSESYVCSPAPRSASVTASYQGATLVELSASSLKPILLNVKTFVPTVAAVVAGRYLDREPGWQELEGAARESRLTLRASRLAESIRQFHDVPAIDETDGRVTARELMGRTGLVGSADDPHADDDALALNLLGGSGGAAAAVVGVAL